MKPVSANRKQNHDEGWLSHERVLALALLVATGIVFYLCYRLILPYLPALAWAVALAIVAQPIRSRVFRWIPYENVAAVVMVVFVGLVIVIPVAFVTQNLVTQAQKYSRQVQQQIESGKWREKLNEYQILKPVVPWIDEESGLSLPPSPSDEADSDAASAAEDGPRRDRSTTRSDTRMSPSDSSKDGASEDYLFGDPAGKQDRSQGSSEKSNKKSSEKGSENGLVKSASTSGVVQEGESSGGSAVGQAATMIGTGVSSIVTNTVYLGMQLLIMFLCLFFFFRDRRQLIGMLRSLMPLSEQETDEVFSRISDTIYATLFGSVSVAFVQGFMGGLIFWWLGLPAPLLWGAIMGLLAVVPVLGTFVVWAPVAVFLAATGDWKSAIILTIWGGVAISLIDNLLYPFLVGKRMQFHTLLVFFSLVGGISLFGTSGIILGPLLLAITDALLDVWQRRTAGGGTIESGVCAEAS